MGKMKALITDRGELNRLNNERIDPIPVYYCFMCCNTKNAEKHGAHEDPFDKDSLICTACYNKVLEKKTQEEEDWLQYEEMQSGE